VAADELMALHAALLGGAAAAAQRFPLTAALVIGVDEGARAAHAASRPEASAVQRGFQFVAGALFGTVLQQLLLSDDESADALLRSYRFEAAPEAASVAPALAAEPACEVASGSEDAATSDSDWEELQAAVAPGGASGEAVDAALQLPLAQRVDAKLERIGARLRFELFDVPGVWEALGLSDVYLRMLQTLLVRPRPSAGRLQSLTVRMLCDRWMRALDPTLPAVLQLLASDDAADLTPIWLLSCLCARAHDDDSVGKASTLWVHVHASWSGAVMSCAQRLAVAACAPPSATARQRALDDAEPLALVLAFYARHAPGGLDVGDLLLPSGVFRNFVALLDAGDRLPSSAPLRRAVLFSCCASPAVAAYASAVPAVSVFLQNDDAHAIVWALLQPAPAYARLQQLVSSATATVSDGQAPPSLALETAVLLRDALLTAGAGRVLLPAAQLGSALKELQAALLSRLGARLLAAADTDGTARTTDEAVDKVHTKCAALLKTLKDILALMGGNGSHKAD
jgi:hypothetical protein